MSLKQHIPNALTCGNLVSGCMSILFVACGMPVKAAVMIFVAGLFDFLDGFAARLLKAHSPIGADLDSLADVVSSGVAPGFIMYWLMAHAADLPDFRWLGTSVLPCLAFLLPVFSAIRLAKFNIDERQHTGFIGMPTPANAIFWGALISSSEAYLTSPRFNAPFLLAFVVMFCWLLVCDIPMFAMKFKSMAWKENRRKYIFLIVCGLVMAFSLVTGITLNHTWTYISRGMATCIVVYLVMSIGLYLTDKR